MTDQIKPGGDGLSRCNRCPPSTIHDDARCLDCPRRATQPTSDAAEGAEPFFECPECGGDIAGESHQPTCTGSWSAPPKPAHDAIRHDLIERLRNLIPVMKHDGLVLSVNTIEDAIAALSAPLPPASIHDAHDDIARGISRGEGEAVPSADGAGGPRTIPRFDSTNPHTFNPNDAGFSLVELDSESLYRDIFAEITAKAKPVTDPASDDPERVRHYVLPVGPLHRAAGRLSFQMFNGEQHLADAVNEIARLKALPPPCAGAAEPVAHYHRPSTMHMGDCSICGNVSDHPSHIGSPLYAASPVRGDREAITRLIYEADSPSDPKDSWKEAQRITDVILSILIQHGTSNG